MTKASPGLAVGYAHLKTVLDADGLALSVSNNGEFTPQQVSFLGDPEGVPYVRLSRETPDGERHHLLHPRGAMALGHALHLAGRLLVDDADQAEGTDEPVGFLHLTRDDEELHESFYASEQYKDSPTERLARELADGPTVDDDPELTVLAKLRQGLENAPVDDLAGFQDFALGQIDNHAEARRLELARPYARHGLGELLERAQRFLERHDGGALSVLLGSRPSPNDHEPEDTWSVAITFGREDPDSDMAAGQALGVAPTLNEALHDALGQARA